MDFFKACGSGVCTLVSIRIKRPSGIDVFQNGWSNFVYHLYGITAQPPSNGSPDGTETVSELATIDRLLEFESILRLKRYIAQADIQRRAIWVFEPTSGEGDFTQGAPHIQKPASSPQLELERSYLRKLI